MLRINRIALLLALLGGTSLVACGGGSPKKGTSSASSSKKTKKTKKKKPTKPKVTAEDLARKREEAAEAFVASGSTCLPRALKDSSSKMSLELGAVGSQAILCAIDHDSERLLGAVGCWNIDLKENGLVFRDRGSIPGRGYLAAIENGCVRGYCLPKDQEVAADQPALIAWSLDGTQTAVAAGDHVHVFSAESKELTKSIALRSEEAGDKAIPSAPTGLWFHGETLFLQGGEGSSSSVWAYGTDGTAAGPLLGLGKGNPPVSMGHGSFSLLDKDRVAVAERGFSTVTIFEVATGKRSKLVRKIKNGPCRSAQVESFFSDEPGEMPAKCVTHLKDTFDSFVGATLVAGSSNYLGALAAERVGELAVIDRKNLSEKRSIKLPWCEEGASGAAKESAMDEEAAGASESLVEDPDSGGQANLTEDEDEDEAPKPKKPKKKKKK